MCLVAALNVGFSDINKNEHQKFYFFAQYANTVPAVVENGVRLKPPTYDVLISRLGITHAATTQLGPVADIESVKKDIVEYFKSHNLGVADTPPDRVIFE